MVIVTPDSAVSANISADEPAVTRHVPGYIGAASGLTGLIVFLVIHAMWITPIWFIAIIGIVVSISGGLLTGKCYELSTRFNTWRPFRSLYVIALVSVTLVPCVLLIQFVPPLLEAENGEVVHPINVPWVVSGFFLLLLIPSAIVGWISGRILTGNKLSGGLFAIMGLLIALGPGHNLPLFGDATGEQLLKALVLTFVPMAAAAIVLAEGAELFAPKESNQY